MTFDPPVSVLRARELVQKLARTPDDDKRFDDFVEALMTGAFLMACADGQMPDDEQRALVEMLTFVVGPVYRMDDIANFGEGVIRKLGKHGGQRELLSRMAELLSDEEAKQGVLSCVTLVAVGDDDFASQERALIDAMGAAMGLSARTVQKLVADVEEVMAR